MVESLMEATAMDHLRKLAAAVPADQVIVEIGVHQAANLVNMALGSKAGNKAKVYGVDPYGTGDIYVGRPHMLDRYTVADHDIAQQHIRDNHVVRLTDIIVATSQVAAENWDSWEGPKIGLLVIDGEHRYGPVMKDFHQWRPHLADNAIVAFDDFGGPVGAKVVTAVDQLIAEGEIKLNQVIGQRLAVCTIPEHNQ